MAVDDRIRLLQDRVLVDTARRGGAPAFDELYRRHARAAWRLALAITPEPGAAGAAVVTAFASALAGPGPHPALASGMRLPLLTATRHAVLDAGQRPGRLVPSIGPADTSSPSVVIAALHALPELWRSTLWLAEVEGLSLADTAAVLELAPAAAGPMVERARLGLRQHVLLLARDDERAQPCRRTLDRMAPYAAGALVARDARRVRDHLDECAPCRDRLAVLDDLPLRLRREVPLLPVALGPAAVRRWAAARHRDTGPFGLTLPGGQPVPPWLERAAAGAVAAAIALGVTGAILAGGRNRVRGDDLVRDTTAAVPLDSGDGEVALGGGGVPDLVLDVVGRTPSAAASTGPDATGAAAPLAASLPRSSGPAPIAGATPGPGAGGPGPGPGTTPPPAPEDPGVPPSSPPPSEPAAEVTVGVGDTLAVTIGDQCTGLELLGTVIGCPPPESDSPITLDTGGSLLPDLGL